MKRKSLIPLALFCILLANTGFSQTPGLFSSKLLIPKNVSLSSSRWHWHTSQTEFGKQIFGTPYGIGSFVYDDPAYTLGQVDFLTIADVAWNRVVLHGENSNGRRIYFRGQPGSTGQEFMFRSPRYISGDERNVYISDTENHRVHVYELDPEVPNHITLRGFDSMAIAYAGDTPTSLRMPMGVDQVLLLEQDGSFFDKQIAVADYGNNRVVIYEDGFNGFGNFPGRSYGQPGLNPLLNFNNPTAVAYAWDKATGRQKHELYVIN